MTTPDILEFNGKYKFLSNFYEARFTYLGKEYPTAEHAYQASKAKLVVQQYWVREAVGPGEAKRRGRKVVLRDDWEEVKLEVMYQICKAKFQNNELGKALIQTGKAKLVEGNYWHDTFWGVCNGVGSNHLGNILMRIRSELPRIYGELKIPLET